MFTACERYKCLDSVRDSFKYRNRFYLVFWNNIKNHFPVRVAGYQVFVIRAVGDVGDWAEMLQFDIRRQARARQCIDTQLKVELKIVVSWFRNNYQR